MPLTKVTGKGISDLDELGVGTTSPRSVNNYSFLTINNSSGAAIDFELGEALKTTMTQSSGQFEINTSANLPMIFKTNNSERLRILAGGGLTFNGDTATANALDDYEEGTWTPAYSSTSASFSYNTQYGNYIKIGGFVHLQFYLNASASGTTSNATTITGLPFAVANLSPFNQSGAAIWFSGSVDIRPLFNNSQSTINLWKKGAVATATASEVNNVYLVGSGSYRAS